MCALLSTFPHTSYRQRMPPASLLWPQANPKSGCCLMAYPTHRQPDLQLSEQQSELAVGKPRFDVVRHGQPSGALDLPVSGNP